MPDPDTIDCSRGDRRTHVARWRAVAVLAAVIVVGLPSVMASADPRPPTAVLPPSTAAIVAPTGVNPSWMRAETGGSTRARSAVDASGRTYLASHEILAESFRPDGTPGFQTAVAGSLMTGQRDNQPPDIAVTDDGQAIVVGGVATGSITFALGRDDEIEFPADPGVRRSFLVGLHADGTIAWARMFADLGIWEVEVAGGIAAVSGKVTSSVTLDDLPPTSTGPGDAFVAGFDVATGAAQWITEITPLAGPPVPDTYVQDLEADLDSVAWLGLAEVGIAVAGGGDQESRTCASAGFAECSVMADLDIATGRPLVAAVVGGDEDHIVDAIAITDDGYTTLGEDRSSPAPPAQEGPARIARLDSSGATIWTTPISGDATIGFPADIVADHNGDVLVAFNHSGTVTLGAGPGAPVVGGTGIVIAEVNRDGAFTRYTKGSGAGPDGWTALAMTLGVDASDVIHFVGDRMAPVAVTLGSGSGAITVPGQIPGGGPGFGPLVATIQPDVAPLSTFHPVAPIRVLDSRTATGGWSAKLVAGTPRLLRIPDTVPSLPSETTAVVLNVTVTDASAMTYVTAWPAGTARPVASNLNVLAGDTISNQVTVRLGDLQAIALATAEGSVNLVADLMGYYDATTSGAQYHSMTPTRLLDSRTSTGGWAGPLFAGSPRDLAVAGANGIPANAGAVTLSITATDTSQQTYLRVQPAGTTANNSNLAINGGQTITNLVTTKIGTGGRITITNNLGSVNVVVDAVGYYDGVAGSRFRPISPARVLDSRFGTGGPATPWGPGATRTVSTTTVAPAGTITAVAANLTATDTNAMSLLTLFPQAPRPATSNLLFTPGQTIASAANTGVAADGTVSLYNQLGTANLVLDIDGYFTSP